MEALFVAIARALASLTGPVAKYAWRRSGKQHLSEVERLLNIEGDDLMKRTALLTRRLTEEGLTQRNQIDLAKFCRSDEGAFCFRLMSINLLAGSPLRERATEELVLQTSAMIRLYMRNSTYTAADLAATVLVREATSEISRSFGKLRTRDPHLARDLQHIAREQSRLPDLFNVRMLHERAESIRALSEVLPSTIENQIEQYASLVRDDTSHIQISAVGRTVPIPISDALINPGVYRRDGFTEENLSFEDSSVLPSLMSRHTRVVLLGDPGGGKSTAVKAATHEFATAAADEDTTTVPFTVVLRHYARALRLDPNLGVVTYLHRSIASDFDDTLGIATLRYLLHTGRAAVLFDGLDEILEIDERLHIVQKIERFSKRFGATPIAVTSRAIGYDLASLDRGYSHYVLGQFSDSDVQSFARNVFVAIETDEWQPDELLRRFLSESEVVRDIRSNPLMLGILCYLFASGRTMPSNRLELYSRCAALLYEDWDDRRGIRLPLQDASAAEQAVREVALTIFKSGEEEVSGTDIRNMLGQFYASLSDLPAFRFRSLADEVFEAWTGRKWILTYAGEQDGEDYFRFAHRTFLEFFAAEQIAYECETAVEAWSRISGYVRTGAATPLCQLVLQVMDRNTRNSGERIVSHALAEAAESLDDDKLVECFNIVSFLSMVLSSIRTSVETRDHVIVVALEIFRRLVPWASVSSVKTLGDLPYVGYRHVFADAQDLVAPSEDYVDDDDEWADVEDFTIDNISTIFKGFASLPSEERRRLLDQARAHVGTDLTAREDRDSWLRLSLAMKQLPRFESWPSVSAEWRQDLQQFGDGLWESALVDGNGPVNADAKRSDFWLNLAWVRDQGRVDSDSLAILGLRGLFIGGWPLPVLDMVRGTVAHTLVLGALGLEADGIPLRWSAETVDELCKAVNQVRAAPDRWSRVLRVDDSQYAPAFDLRRVREDELFEDVWSAIGYLVGVLRELGDEGFVSSVMRSLDPHSRDRLRGSSAVSTERLR